MINDTPPVKNSTRSDRLHRSLVARKKRKVVKETIASRLQNMYNKARRARKSKR